jgi:hypothetical protein
VFNIESHRAATSDLDSAHLQDRSRFESSAILPVQFFSGRRVKPEVEPERRLALAVLADAVRCFQLNAGANSRTKIRQFVEAKSWLFETEDKGPFSFDSICCLLDINPNSLRKGLRRWRALKLAGNPSLPLIRHSSVKRRPITVRNKTTRLRPTR